MLNRDLSANDTSARPAFRIAGASLLVATALLFFFQSLPLFSASKAFTASCPTDKVHFSCEIGALMLSALPLATRGPVLALTGIAVSALCVRVAWALLRGQPDAGRKDSGS